MRGEMLRGQYIQRLGDERDCSRLGRTPGRWSRESKGEHGKIGEVSRGQAMWIPVGWVENFDF